MAFKNGKNSRCNYQVDKEPLVNIPIVVPKKEYEERIVRLYDQIFNKSKDDDNYDSLENEIDNIFYTIYNLNDKDIKIINNEIDNWEKE